MANSLQPVRFSLNLTLDGCYDHQVGIPSKDQHLHAAECIASADTLLFGRVTYQLMESAWRPSPTMHVPPGKRPEWMDPFAKAIDEAKKYVVSSTLKKVEWNSELVQGDIAKAVQALKQKPGRGIFVGGVKLAMALTELGLIDEYEFLIHPRIAGHGPTLFSGLSKIVDLKLVGRKELEQGAVALKYVPKK